MDTVVAPVLILGVAGSVHASFSIIQPRFCSMFGVINYCFQASSVLRMPGNVWYDFAGLFSN